MLPSASLAALDAWPSVHPFGMCGQDGSTTNFGTSTFDAGRGGVAEARCDPAIPNTTTTAKTMAALNHKFRFRFIMRILLLVSSWNYSDSTESIPSRNFGTPLPSDAAA
jgi:hypothetical protein